MEDVRDLVCLSLSLLAFPFEPVIVRLNREHDHLIETAVLLLLCSRV